MTPGSRPCESPLRRLARRYAQVKKKSLVLPVLLALAWGASSGCGERRRVESGDLVVGIEANPTQLDPRLSQDAVSSQVQRFIFNRLIARDQEGRLVPELASSWERPTPLVHRFELRRGVRFHDGAPLTSADVKYTFDSIRDPALASPKAAGLEELARIETPTPHSVVFHLREPSASFAESLMVGILPESARGAGRRFAQRPVGTGPFEFAEFAPDDRVTLRAFAGHFGGRPAFERLVFRILPEETIRVLELESGGVDFLQNSFSPDLLPRLLKNERLRVRRRLGTNFSYIGFNLSDPILSRLKVRRAIAHAIDRAPIVRFILKGIAREADSLLPPTHWAHEKGLPRYAHRPALARKLLDEAGFPDPDGPGPRPRFTLIYKTSQNELRRRVAAVLAHQLAAVGIEMKIRSYEWGTFFGDVRSGNFQLYSLTWVGISDPDIYRHIFHSRFTPPAGLNRGGYANARVDALLEAARADVRADARARMYGEAQRILGAELPYVNLWHSVNVAAFDRRISGYRVFPDEDLISLARVRLSPGARRGGE